MGITTDLKRIRERRHLTLEQLEKISGVSKSTINRLEKGEVQPMHETALKLERALGVRLRFQSAPSEAA